MIKRVIAIISRGEVRDHQIAKRQAKAEVNAIDIANVRKDGLLTMKKQCLRMVSYDSKKQLTSEEIRTMIRLFGKELQGMVNELQGKIIDFTELMESLDTFNKSLEDLTGKLTIQKDGAE